MCLICNVTSNYNCRGVLSYSKWKSVKKNLVLYLFVSTPFEYLPPSAEPEIIPHLASFLHGCYYLLIYFKSNCISTSFLAFQLLSLWGHRLQQPILFSSFFPPQQASKELSCRDLRRLLKVRLFFFLFLFTWEGGEGGCSLMNSQSLTSG